MTKKKKIAMNALLLVIALVAGLLILNLTYQSGRDKGRSETIEMVNAFLSEYNFVRIEDEDGWRLGSSKGGHFFPNYDGSIWSHSYDWDDGKIRLSYEK